jgi:hypothetical protein
MSFKIFANGFIFNEGAYLKDAWNIMDFTIIFSGYLPMVIGSNTINLTALR